MKTMKRLALAGMALLVLLAGGVYWLSQSMDGLVKTGIEKYGPVVTKVPVKVAAVEIKPVDGGGAIRGLEIGNPSGYKTPVALKAGEIRLAIDPATLAKDVVVVREVVIQSPVVNYEAGSSGNNLEAIQKNIEAYVASMSSDKRDAGAPKKKLVIENLYIRDAKVSLTSAMTLGSTVTASLPDLHLRGIGRKSNGATADEVVQQVWGALVRSTGNVASRAGNAIMEGGKSVIEGAKGLFR